MKSKTKINLKARVYVMVLLLVVMTSLISFYIGKKVSTSVKSNNNQIVSVTPMPTPLLEPKFKYHDCIFIKMDNKFYADEYKNIIFRIERYERNSENKIYYVSYAYRKQITRDNYDVISGEHYFFDEDIISKVKCPKNFDNR